MPNKKIHDISNSSKPVTSDLNLSIIRFRLLTQQQEYPSHFYFSCLSLWLLKMDPCNHVQENRVNLNHRGFSDQSKLMDNDMRDPLKHIVMWMLYRQGKQHQPYQA